MEVLLTRNFRLCLRADFILVICLFINYIYHPAFSFPFLVWNPALQISFLSSFRSYRLIAADPRISPSPVLQIADDLGNEKFCIDASQSGAGNWLKYIRVACSCDEQNLAVCHVNDQVTTWAMTRLPCSPHRFCSCRGGSAGGWCLAAALNGSDRGTRPFSSSAAVSLK